MKNTLMFGAAVSVALTFSSDARAHGYVIESVPSRNQHVVQPLKTVRVEFSIKADARYSTLSLQADDGSLLARKTQPEASRYFDMKAPQLQPGRYHLVYAILSPDGDMLRGTINFVVDG
jgi:methionine-rich copper-binding protein CopC